MEFGFTNRISPVHIRILVILEVICCVLFVAFSYSGQPELAWAVFLIPFQLLAWFVLAQKDLWLVSFLAFMLPLSVLNLLPAIYRNYLLVPVTLILLLFLRWDWFRQERNTNKRYFSKIDKFFPLALAGWMVISLIMAFSRGWGSGYLLKYNFYTLQTFIIGYFCAVVPRDSREVRTVLLANILGSVVAVFLMVIIVQLEGATNWLSLKRVPITFGLIDFNAVGGVFATSAVALLGLYVSRETRFVSVIGIVLLLTLLVVSRSRGAWLGFGFAFLYLLFRARSAELIFASGIGGLVIMLTDILRSILTRRLSETSVGDPALAGRAVLWNFAWRVSKANWLFGVGWENFRLVKPHYGFPVKLVRNWTDYNAHNIFLEIMADLGVVGLFLFLGLFLRILIQLDRIARDRKSPSQGIAIALNAGLICFLVHGVWDCLSYIFLLLGVWVGLALAISRIASAGGGGENKPEAFN